MTIDPNRQRGFYWVRFEGKVIVAEYATECVRNWAHWHVPQSSSCFGDEEVCELLSDRIPHPSRQEQAQIHERNRVETDGDAVLVAAMEGK